MPQIITYHPKIYMCHECSESSKCSESSSHGSHKRHQVFVWLNPNTSTSTADLTSAIHWSSCRLARTNVKSKVDAACVAVGITLDKAVIDLTITDAPAGTVEKRSSSFIVTDDATVPYDDSLVVWNRDPNEPLHRLHISLTGYGGSANPSPGGTFVVLDFH